MAHVDVIANMGLFKIMNKLYLIFLIFLASDNISFSQNKGAIRFTFVKAETWEPVSDSVYVVLNDSIKLDLLPDSDGNYLLKPVDPGKYTIKVSSNSYEEQIVKKVKVYSDHNCYVSVGLIVLGNGKSKKKR